MTPTEQLKKQADRNFWLCSVMSIANFFMSMYVMEVVKDRDAATYFLVVGAVCAIGAWANSRTCRKLDNLP